MSIALGKAAVHVRGEDGWQRVGFTAGPVELQRVDTHDDTHVVEVIRPVTITTKLAPRTIGWLERLLYPGRVAERDRRRDDMRRWARRKGRLK